MKYSIDPNARCAVIGAGSWATAIVKILLENEKRIAWYIREPEIRESIAANGTNALYLQDVHFDADRLDISGDVNEVFEQADLVVLAVPSAYIKTTLQPLRVSLENKFIVSAIKGIIANEYITIAEFIMRIAVSRENPASRKRSTRSSTISLSLQALLPEPMPSDSPSSISPRSSSRKEKLSPEIFASSFFTRAIPCTLRYAVSS